MTEFLVVIAIIGVIAVMTLPGLLRYVDEQKTIRTLSIAYTKIQQSFKYGKLEHGSVVGWVSGTDPDSSKSLLDKMLYNIKRGPTCTGDESEHAKCGWIFPTKYISGAEFSKLNAQAANFASTQFIDGIVVGVVAKLNLSQCYYPTTAHGVGFIDINGQNGPNRLGVDIFAFRITEDGLEPFGSVSYTAGSWFSGAARNECATLSPGNCKTYGVGCTSIVLNDKNMDYLH